MNATAISVIEMLISIAYYVYNASNDATKNIKCEDCQTFLPFNRLTVVRLLFRANIHEQFIS